MIVVLLVVLAMYINYENVAKQRGQSIIADMNVGLNNMDLELSS